MLKKRQITISGHPGAGKSSTGKKIAELLRYKFFSAGDFRRMAATELGLDIDTLNMLETFKLEMQNKGLNKCVTSSRLLEEAGLRSEYHDSFQKLMAYGDTDILVDNQQKNLASTTEEIIVEGRLAYLHFPNAFKVFFYCEPTIAASRVFKDKRNTEKGHSSEEDVLTRIKDSMESDRQRYIAKYGKIGDCYTYEKANFNLYIDTSHMEQQEVIDKILKEYSYEW